MLLYYVKSDDYIWNPQYQPYDAEYLETFFDHEDADGRRWKRMDLTGAGTRNGETGQPWRGIDITGKGRHWAWPPSQLDRLDSEGRIHWPSKSGGMPRLKQYEDQMPGVPLQDVWTDIRPLHNLAAERLGYPTQKPEALLERIVQASSNTGDIVLDPFCGCGTAVAAAQNLGRCWIGIDITHLAISLIRYRLQSTFGPAIEKSYSVTGEPIALEDARQLAGENRYQFQWWALGLVGARPEPKDQKKGADKGIDGRLFFIDDVQTKKANQAIISVKSGHLKPDDVRALIAVVDREKAAIGALLTLEEPTPKMRSEAAAAGFYQTPFAKNQFPKLQILTVADLLAGKRIDMPWQAITKATFKEAPRATRRGAKDVPTDLPYPEAPE